MTPRQQRRLELAERLCRLVMRNSTCGLVESEGYQPDVVSAMHFAHARILIEGKLPPDSLPHMTRHAEAIKKAVYEWMEAVGIDPQSCDKAEAKRMALDMAQEVFGSGYEADIEQLPTAKRVWVEKTADDRAAVVAQEYCSGKIKGFEELRIAIAAEILEAEHVARDPFVEYAKAIFRVVEDKGEGAEKRLTGAITDLLKQSWRWMGVVPKEDREVVACGEELE
jgi:hypothetical protein